jgi:hypothetical protein
MNADNADGQEKITMTRDKFEAEIRRRVEEQVQKLVRDGVVADRIARVKMITPKKRKEINDFFDSLKVKTDDQGELFKD